jgi:hypothetical protein
VARTDTKWGFVYASIAAYGDCVVEVDLESWDGNGPRVRCRKLVVMQPAGKRANFLPFFPPKFGLVDPVFEIERSAIILRGKPKKDAVRLAKIAWDPNLATEEEKREFRKNAEGSPILVPRPGSVPPPETSRIPLGD